VIKKYSSKFDAIEPQELTLRLVSIPKSDIEAKLGSISVDEGKKLSPLDELADTFMTPPLRRHLHIIVQPPSKCRHPIVAVLAKPLTLPILCIAAPNYPHRVLSPSLTSYLTSMDHRFMLIATFPLLRISFRKSSSPYALVSSMLSLTSPPRFSFLLLRLAYSHLATLFLTAPLYCCVFVSQILLFALSGQFFAHSFISSLRFRQC